MHECIPLRVDFGGEDAATTGDGFPPILVAARVVFDVDLQVVEEIERISLTVLPLNYWIITRINLIHLINNLKTNRFNKNIAMCSIVSNFIVVKFLL